MGTRRHFCPRLAQLPFQGSSRDPSWCQRLRDLLGFTPRWVSSPALHLARDAAAANPRRDRPAPGRLGRGKGTPAPTLVFGEFGSGSGTPFSYSGPDRWGPITAFRIWEHCNSFLSGIQLQFGNRWGELYGAKTQRQLEVTLLPRERITQISGKHYTYVYQLIISTSQGRIFFFGQPYGNSFNAVPLSRTEYLAFLTGHYSGSCLTGIAMHWAEPRTRE